MLRIGCFPFPLFFIVPFPLSFIPPFPPCIVPVRGFAPFPPPIFIPLPGRRIMLANSTPEQTITPERATRIRMRLI
jgi:hypothetical protein